MIGLHWEFYFSLIIGWLSIYSVTYSQNILGVYSISLFQLQSSPYTWALRSFYFLESIDR